MSGSKFQSDVDRLIQEGQQKQQEIEQQMDLLLDNKKIIFKN